MYLECAVTPKSKRALNYKINHIVKYWFIFIELLNLRIYFRKKTCYYSFNTKSPSIEIRETKENPQ